MPYLPTVPEWPGQSWLFGSCPARFCYVLEFYFESSKSRTYESNDYHIDIPIVVPESVCYCPVFTS